MVPGPRPSLLWISGKLIKRSSSDPFRREVSEKWSLSPRSKIQDPPSYLVDQAKLGSTLDVGSWMFGRVAFLGCAHGGSWFLDVGSKGRLPSLGHSGVKLQDPCSKDRGRGGRGGEKGGGYLAELKTPKYGKIQSPESRTLPARQHLA